MRLRACCWPVLTTPIAQYLCLLQLGMRTGLGGLRLACSGASLAAWGTAREPPRMRWAVGRVQHAVLETDWAATLP